MTDGKAVTQKSRSYIPLRKKLEILKQASSTSVKGTARKFKVSPKQIRDWRRNVDKIKERCESNAEYRTVHKGMSREHPELEKQLSEWMQEQRKNEVKISGDAVIQEALRIKPNFKNTDTKRLRNWVYPFLKRNNVSIKPRKTLKPGKDEAPCRPSNAPEASA